MKTFKFLSGAICLFLFLTSCEADPIYEDIDTNNLKGQTINDNTLSTISAIEEKPIQRTEGEDDKPDTSRVASGEMTFLDTSLLSFTEGEDDKPESGFVSEGEEKPLIIETQSRTEGEDDKPNN